jgi:hypothetical protein
LILSLCISLAVHRQPHLPHLPVSCSATSLFFAATGATQYAWLAGARVYGATCAHRSVPAADIMRTGD